MDSHQNHQKSEKHIVTFIYFLKGGGIFGGASKKSENVLTKAHKKGIQILFFWLKRFNN